MILIKLHQVHGHGSASLGNWQDMAKLDELRVAARTLVDDGYISTSDANTLNIRIKTKGIAFVIAGGYKKHFEDLRERQGIEMNT